MNERRGPELAAPAHAELAVEATGLTKSYKDVHVLSGVDIGVPAGTVFALLGPNGAGKTTTVRILATLVQADGGQARVAGFDVARTGRKVRRRISLTGQFAALDEVQTGTENLRMMGRLSGLSRTAGPGASARAARAVRADQGGRAPGGHLLGRDAPPPRHRRQPGRPAVGDLPGRAVDRPGPAEPAGHVAGHRGPGRLGRDHLPHHPVPGRGRTAGRPDRGPGRRARSSPRAPRPSSSARSPPSGSTSPAPAGPPTSELISYFGDPDSPPRRRRALTVGVPDRGRRRRGQGAARRGRPRPRPDRGLPPAPRHPGRRFPHPDRPRQVTRLVKET